MDLLSIRHADEIPFDFHFSGIQLRKGTCAETGSQKDGRNKWHIYVLKSREESKGKEGGKEFQGKNKGRVCQWRRQEKE